MQLINKSDVEKITDWLKHRGGVAVWQSVDLSNPGAQVMTPALTENGQPYPKPHWRFANEPARIIRESDEFVVVEMQEVKRFHVAVRRGDGLSFKLTDASSAKVRKAVHLAGEDATYEFDYDTQEAVIFAVAKRTPLVELVSCSA